MCCDTPLCPEGTVESSLAGPWQAPPKTTLVNTGLTIERGCKSCSIDGQRYGSDLTEGAVRERWV